MAYRIEYTMAAGRCIRKLSPDLQARVLAKMEAVSREPRGMGAVKLSGHNAYRVRVGDYRIIYSVLDDRLLVLVVAIGHRRDVYRDW